MAAMAEVLGEAIRYRVYLPADAPPGRLWPAFVDGLPYVLGAAKAGLP